ncbi:MAG: HAD family hydrolase [Verrucomicrobiota bacterium]
MKTAPSSHPVNAFAGVIFDLDGTLLDTLADIGNAANAVLAQHNFPTHPISAYRQFVGEGVRVLLTRSLPSSHRDEETIEACLKTMQVEYPRNLNKTAQPYPGVPQVVSTLKARGLRLAVLSNKPDEFTAACVEQFFGKGLFDPIFGLHPDRPRKPDPAGALAISGGWGIPTPNILYVGDSGTDMQTAIAANMYPVGVLWGYRDEAELLAAGAKELIRTPADLGAVKPRQ